MLITQVAGESLALLPQRCAYWRRTRTLLVADLHLGKAATFRRAGVPAPEGSTAETLARLTHAVERSGAERILALGDLLHAASGRSPETMASVQEWTDHMTRRGVALTLVRGNHDRSAGDPPASWQFERLDGPVNEGPFIWRHEPPAEDSPDNAYTIAGHLHPAALLHCATGASVRAPCFWFGASVGVLPAFGAFTGAKVIRPKQSDSVFVVGDGAVVQVSANANTPATA